MYPKSIQNVIEAFKYLPGIGDKTAERMALHLLNLDKVQTDFLADSIKNLQEKKDTLTMIKPDTFAMSIVDDKVLKARMQSAKMCNVKEIMGPKLGYTHHFVPLSAYDYLNYQTYGVEKLEPKPKLERPKTASEFALRNFDKYSKT